MNPVNPANPVDIHHLAAAYALDALDETERRAFEAHYPACDVCRRDVIDHRETLGELAAASPVAPSAGLRANVLAELARTRQLSPILPGGVADLDERRSQRLQRVAGRLLAAAAALVLVIGAAVVIGRDGGRGDGGFEAELAAVVEQVDARIVTLDPTGAGGADGATGSVRVSWSEEAGRAVVLAAGLRSPTPGTAYELWLIDDGGPVPMRLLAEPADGTIRGAVDIDRSPGAWGVTIEPTGGSPAPTGEILFVAEV